MTDWFVDIAAAGTGSGDTPTNAWTSIASMTSAASGSSSGVGSLMNFGDRIWVRRSHLEALNPSSPIGRFHPAFSAASHAPGMIIGWPSSGSPLYDERPSSARSGSSPNWDADVGTPYGADALCNLTTFTTSGNTNWNDGWGFANVLHIQSGAGQPTANYWNGNKNLPLINVHMYGSFNLDKAAFQADLIITSSCGGTGCMQGGGTFRKLTFTNSCLVGNSPLFNNNSALLLIDELVINTSSIQSIAPVANGLWLTSIGLARGTMPNSGMLPAPASNGGSSAFFCNDWFGQGPVWGANFGSGWGVSVTSGTTATYSGANVIMVDVHSFSVVGINEGVTPRNFDTPSRVVEAWINVTSGVNCQVDWNFLQTASLSANGTGGMNHPLGHELSIWGKGGGTFLCGSAMTVPGSSSRWSGTSVAVGSAWIARAKFTPTITGSMRAGFKPNLGKQLPSGGQFFCAPYPDVSSF